MTAPPRQQTDQPNSESSRPSARIVLGTFGSLGDLNPYISLALELARRGHQPLIATSPYYREKIEKLGLGFAPVRPDSPARELLPEFMDRVMDPRKGPETVIRDIFMGSIRQTYEDLVPVCENSDLLITHPLTFAMVAVADCYERPWVSTVLAPMSFFSAYDPPVPPAFPALKNLRWLGPGFHRSLIRLAKRKLSPWLTPYHQLRQHLGLRPRPDPLFDDSHSNDLVLALYSQCLGDPQPDWPANTIVTGFCFHDEDTVQVDESNTALEEFLDDGSPPIVFTLGSSAVWAARDFYRQSMNAAIELGHRAILLIGHDDRNTFTSTPPRDIAVFRYAPYSRLFPRAAAIVHQGGVGTTAQALKSGRPMLVVPYGFDQHDNAERVARLGIARVLPRNQYTTRHLVRELRKLLNEPGYSSNGARVAAKIQQENGPETAADAIESFLFRRHVSI